MSARNSLAIILLWVVSSGVSWAQAPPAPQPVAAPPSAAEVEQWVADLNSDQFQLREAATLRLIAAGPAAIDRVSEAVAKGPLEVVIRGVHVLRELALSGDDDVQELARAALERIASVQLTAAARRAEVTIASLNETRQTRAMEELQRLGARIGMSHVQLGFQVVESATQLEIGTEWRGTVKDLNRLKWLNGIQQVRFTGPKVTNEWLGALKYMPHLTSLTLKRTDVTSAGLAVVRDLDKLQVVWVMYSPVDDEAVPHLLTRKHLAQVKLYGTKVTRGGAKRLADELLSAKIDHRQGGFMGVNCQAHPLGCEVVLVQTNTAAANAGLEASDVIVKYGDKRVETFETLTSFISENQPGDKVDLLVARDLRVRRGTFDHAAGLSLGLTLKPHALGCEITAVAADGAGAQLELKPGDVVTAYKETRTLDPKTLDDAFRTGEPGGAASLDFIRAPNLLTKTVTLGEWE